MNKLLLVAVMGLTTSAFANVCHVKMVDARTNRPMIDTHTNRPFEKFHSYDEFDGCKEAMKDCRMTIRMRDLRGRADCLRDSVDPVPTLNHDSERHIQNGESVIMNNKYFTVLGASINNLYAVRSTDGWNSVTNRVRRDDLAVTSGSNLGLRVNESVINISTNRYVTVAGLTYDDRFVTKSIDGWNTLTTGVDRMNLAETKGCVENYYRSQVCVGNQVINQYNRYMTVVGIQLDGQVVLKTTDGWNTLQANVDPMNLVVTH